MTLRPRARPGKAPIDEIRIEDTIPKDFENPAEVTMIIEEKEVSADNVTLRFEPDTESVDDERKMIVETKDVLEHIGELDAETCGNTYRVEISIEFGSSCKGCSI
ncbi:MAG: hypothetical protein ACTSSI_14520 [Candidatus Helarchaeota archaeon]